MSTAPGLLGASASPAVERAGQDSLGVLARVEMVRLARHPMFVLATALGILFTAMALNEQSDQVTGDSLGLPVVALTVGLGAMIAANQLTRSFHRARELVDATPTSLTTRTGALCLTALVPALVASGWLFIKYVVRPPAVQTPEWMYGTFSVTDIAWVLLAHTAVAAVGATLLGVAAGRWWRFRGASVVLVATVVTWTMGAGAALGTGGAMPAWQRWVHLFTPLTFFSTTSQDSSSVDSLSGSPGWYVVWLLTLCALAATGALLWRATGTTRRRLVLIGAIVLAISAVVYVLAVTGGNGNTVRSYPDGQSVVLRP